MFVSFVLVAALIVPQCDPHHWGLLMGRDPDAGMRVSIFRARMKTRSGSAAFATEQRAPQARAIVRNRRFMLESLFKPANWPTFQLTNNGLLILDMSPFIREGRFARHP